MNAQNSIPTAGWKDSRIRTGLDAKFAKFEVWILVATCAVAWIWMWLHLHQAFLFEDDPVFAHQAERVLQGEIPHVDYHEVYTGGLSYLGALAMRMFGVHLMAPRYALFGFFCAWVPAFWYVARRFFGPLAASLLTLLAVSWSTPLYPSPVPSWYNLFFATFGAAALMRFVEVRRAKWLLLAGICGGLSFLVKVSGLYFIAAAGLFLLFDEQEEHRRATLSSRAWAVSVAVTAALLGFIVMLVETIRKLPYPVEYYNFLVPGEALGCLLLYREWMVPRASSGARVSGLAARLVPFLAGVFLPVLIFCVPYMLGGTMHQMANGVLVLPQARFTTYVVLPAPVYYALYSVPFLAVLVLDRSLKNVSLRRYAALVVTAGLGGFLFICWRNLPVARRLFVSASSSIPLIIVGCAAFIFLRPEAPRQRTSQFFLLVATVALCNLNQFPFSGAFYFCYIAPLLMLLLGAYVHFDGAQRFSLALPVAVFFLLFAVLLAGPEVYATQFSGSQFAMGPFVIERARGVSGGRYTVDIVERVTSEVARRCAGAPIYAGPNAAGFYFLTGCRNATPDIFEFVSGPDGEPDAILKRIDAAGVHVVVLSRQSGMSGPPPVRLEQGLIARFPEGESIGPFEIRWKP